MSVLTVVAVWAIAGARNALRKQGRRRMMPMTEPWLGAYPGELTDEDRSRLEDAGLTVYENGHEAPPGKWKDGDPPLTGTPHQIVGADADGALDADGQIVDALGRRPKELSLRPQA
jgi:hypothetical protein